MPGLVFHVGATATCPHAGHVTVMPGSTRVLLAGLPAATLADTFLVAGCAFTVGVKPQPCVTVRWLTPSTRVTVNGSPLILQTSTGLALSAEQIPNGSPTVAACQTRVVAT